MWETVTVRGKDVSLNPEGNL
ncbi:hypothetical protein Godav_017987 [Gossypium davidsonii]|uniref:Uncharacterized protein n=1 Tax=Gossypium davidsonii TaxID=34287 RepID=A0A7J8QV66_GOSDV|nr:hypothetical protein [Gossypium davidsonii]